MIIHIDVKDRVATYRSLGVDPVCGNNTDTVKFHFDEAWHGINPKTARFVWGNRYHDVEFTGDSCPVPMFWNVTNVEIGVYAGEPIEEEPSFSTTRAVVPYRLSVRCGYDAASPESGNGYTNEAKGYALEAQAAAEIATQAAFSAEELVKDAAELIEDAYGMREIGRATFLLRCIEADDVGSNYMTWSFGGQHFNDRNGSMKLISRGDFPDLPEDHAFAETLIELLRAPLARVILTHSDPTEVLNHKTVYSGLADGEAWDWMEVPNEFDGSTWVLGREEWHTGGLRLVVSDNPTAPSVGYGPYCVFLQLPLEMKRALEAAMLEYNNTDSYVKMTIIAYQ